MAMSPQTHHLASQYVLQEIHQQITPAPTLLDFMLSMVPTAWWGQLKHPVHSVSHRGLSCTSTACTSAAPTPLPPAPLLLPHPWCSHNSAAPIVPYLRSVDPAAALQLDQLIVYLTTEIPYASATVLCLKDKAPSTSTVSSALLLCFWSLRTESYNCWVMCNA